MVVFLLFRNLILFCLAVLCFPKTTFADTTLRPVPVATLYEGGGSDVLLCGDTLWLTSPVGLEIFDFSTESGPRRLSQAIRLDGAKKISRVGETVAVVTSTDSLVFYYVHSGEVVEQTGSMPSWYSPRALKSYRGYFYYTDKYSLTRIKPSDNHRPIVDYWQDGGGPHGGLAFSGDSLFCYFLDGLTRVYDIFSVPIELGTLQWPLGLASFVHEQPRIYAAKGTAGAAIYEYSISNNVQLLGDYQTYGDVIDILHRDSLLYLADAVRGLMVLGINDPEQSYLYGVNEEPEGLAAIALDGNLIAAAATNGAYTIDVSYPFHPQTVASQRRDWNVRDLAVDNEFLVAVVDQVGLAVIDIGDPAQPLVVSETAFAEEIRGVDIQGNLVAMACGSEGLILAELTDPASPMEIFRTKTIGFALDVDLDGTFVTVSDGNEGFRIFDITDPANARLVGGKSVNKTITAAIHRGRYVYAAGPQFGLGVYDLANIFKPTEVFRMVPHDSTRHLYITDNLLFLSTARQGVQVYDLAVPSTPVLIDRWDFISAPRAVAGEGSLYQVIDDQLGLATVDYRNTGSAEVLCVQSLANRAGAVAVNGENIYLSGPAFLHMLQLDPPLLIGDFDNNGVVALTDLVGFINFVFRDGQSPLRPGAVDFDGNRRYNLVDVALFVQLLYPR